MNDIRVWAPQAHGVELDCDGRRLRMAGSDAGWWRTNGPFIQHGVDYAFYIDGKGPFPDPRSPWQPQGVHGPSRWVDHDRFAWTDPGWQQPPLGSAVIYELHVGTFTPNGDFDSAIAHLDHLVDLGVTHVELMPVAEFSGDRGWGYDSVDLYAPHHAYGGPEALKRLVDACHQSRLAVLLDVVYNHLGPIGNYLGQFGPYFTDRFQTPWGQAVNLDEADSDQVRRFFIDNALMWLRDYHIDGLRIDAVHAIVDRSAIHFLEQLAFEVRLLEANLGRHLVLIAESDLNDTRVVRPPELGGYGLDAMWNEDFHHALHAMLTGEQNGYYQDFGRLSDLATALTQGLVYGDRYSRYRRRRHGRTAKGLSGNQFVSCLQNHDQVGNRPMGDRVTHLLSPGQLKIGAALLMTSPFVPLLFQGEEWGASTPFLYFTDHHDPALGEAVKRGRRREYAAFGWDPEKIPDPQAKETFLESKLDWQEPFRMPHRDMRQWYGALIKLRRRHPALTDGCFSSAGVSLDGTAGWLTVTRGSVLVVCNFAGAAQEIPCSGLGTKEIVLASEKGVAIADTRILVPGHAVVILDDHDNAERIPKISRT